MHYQHQFETNCILSSIQFRFWRRKRYGGITGPSKVIELLVNVCSARPPVSPADRGCRAVSLRRTGGGRYQREL